MKRQRRIPPTHTSRDVAFLGIGGDRMLAISCDAAGGIGVKLHDVVKAAPELVGKLTARVALMELLAVGADPVALTGTFPVEPEPTGNLLLEGIMEEVRNTGLRKLRITCTSEKNVKVTQTGVGVTAVGLLSISELMIGRCMDGDEVLAIGRPSVGQEVVLAERKGTIAETSDVIKLRKRKFVHELIPVGSKGIAHEACVIAGDSGLAFKPNASGTHLEKSAGPSTVLLLATRSGATGKVKRLLGYKPLMKVGVLSERI